MDYFEGNFGDCKEKKCFGRRNLLAGVVVRFVGEGKGEGGAFLVAFAVVKPNVAAVGLNDVFDNGQAKPGASLLARAGFVPAKETLEDALTGVFRDAGAVVRDVDDDGIAVV